MNRIFYAWLIALTLTCFAADGKPGVAGAAAPCEPGSLGCACDAYSLCRAQPDLVCVSGACVAEAEVCEIGSLGCACTARDTCGAGPRGEPLACRAGMCERATAMQRQARQAVDPIGLAFEPAMRADEPTAALRSIIDPGARCPAGTKLGDPACACEVNTDCWEPNETCRDNQCVVSDCAPGAVGCRCDFGACDQGAACTDGDACVDATGLLGGACYDNGRCADGLRCVDDRCGLCNTGQQACQCKADDTCNLGLSCEAGLCIAVREPGAPVGCATPCDGNLIRADASVAICRDGLLNGCLEGASCRSSQCVPDGQQPQTCELDSQCPDFQACIEGRCRSNCETSAQCTAGMTCHRRVCRLPCESTGASCPNGTRCSLDDSGQRGVCESVVVRPPNGTDPGTPRGRFSLTPSSLALTSVQRVGVVRIENPSEAPISLTVRKTAHRYLHDDGTVARTTLWGGCEAGGSGCACLPPSATAQCTQSTDACVGGLCMRGTAAEAPSTECAGEAGCVCAANGQCDGALMCKASPTNAEKAVCVPACVGAACPLHFLTLGAGEDRASVPELKVTVPPGASLPITVEAPSPPPQSRWEGELAVFHPALGVQTVHLGYADTPAGGWGGDMVYFANFEDAGIDAWMAGDLCDRTAALQMPNPFMRAWARFRCGFERPRRFYERAAATRTGAWAEPEVARKCASIAEAGAVCYPAYSRAGVALYTADPQAEPIPSGVLELPLALRIGEGGGSCATGESCYAGAIDSEVALHYAGSPGIRLRFAVDPRTGCSRSGAAGCMVDITELEARIPVGARWRASAADPNCGDEAAFALAATPWLAPGFGPELGGPGAEKYYECQQRDLPRAGDDPAVQLSNQLIAAANPVPSGRAIDRTLELVDGVLIDARTLIILFRERMTSLLPGVDDAGSAAYGYAVLSKTDGVPPAEVPPIAAPVAAPLADAAGAPMCDDDLLAALGAARPTAGQAWDAVARAVLDGALAEELSPANPSDVHYLCWDTGRFDGIPKDSGGVTEHEACPAASRVTYFTVAPGSLDRQALGALACQRDGSCADVLERWRVSGTHDVAIDAPYVCADPDHVVCDPDRGDLRVGKTFYHRGPGLDARPPLAFAIERAFRYRTQFVDREGRSMGFAPQICESAIGATDYCYDPAAIDEAHERLDCALAVYTGYAEGTLALDDGLAARLYDTVVDNLGHLNTEGPLSRLGLAPLEAELLIMLGDESYTRALTSRFDRAGSRAAAFPGSQFEPGGIDLSGIAGAELRYLYQAIQHYQLVLERFYALAPAVAAAERAGARPLMTRDLVVAYVDRVVRASAQKARAWSEVAGHYQSLNRPELAARVIRRGYTAAYLESMLLTNIVEQVADASLPRDRAQIAEQLASAQRTLRLASADLRSTHEGLSDSIGLFGYAPGYIPFPLMDHGRDNPIEAALADARYFLERAVHEETNAIEADRGFNSEPDKFQLELQQLDSTYEGRLIELCGGVQIDGMHAPVPAIARKAHLDPALQLLGDPCGRVGQGEIHDALGRVQIAATELDQVVKEMDNVLKEAAIEEQRYRNACAEIESFADVQVTEAKKTHTLQHEISGLRVSAERAQRLLGHARSQIQIGLQGATFDAPKVFYAQGAALLDVGLATGAEIATISFEEQILSKEKEVSAIELGLITLEAKSRCDLTAIDGKANVEKILLRKSSLELSSLSKQLEIQLGLARVRHLFTQARRYDAEWEEARLLSVRAEAARNDPNVRIYRNEAVIRADFYFELARKYAYRLAKVLEYYYAERYPLDDLYLARMATDLSQFVDALFDGYRCREQLTGDRNPRVVRLSLRDDILRIPRLATDGRALSVRERDALFRAAFTAPARIDVQGRTTIAFNTRRNQLSPSTWGHKLRYIEADVRGGGLGDFDARVGLRITGSGLIATGGEGEPVLYALPARRALVNAFLNGVREYAKDAGDPEVYRSRELTERPFVNTNWEIVFDPLGEPQNRDIDVTGIEDIRLYLYFYDFTKQDDSPVGTCG